MQIDANFKLVLSKEEFFLLERLLGSMSREETLNLGFSIPEWERLGMIWNYMDKFIRRKEEQNGI